MSVTWKEHIVSTPDVLKGKPRLKGTRIPVSLVLGYLAAGYTTQEIIEEFPDIKPDHIPAFLDCALDLAGSIEAPPDLSTNKDCFAGYGT